MIHIFLVGLAMLPVLVVASALIAQVRIGVGVTVPILTAVGEKPIIPSIISAAFILLSVLFSRLGKYISLFSTDIENVKEKLEKKIDRYQAKKR